MAFSRKMTIWSRDQLDELNLDAFLTLYKENEFPLELGTRSGRVDCSLASDLRIATIQKT